MEDIPNISDNIIRSLRANGIFTVGNLAITDICLLAKCGISGERALDLVAEARDLIEKNGFRFKMGTELLQELENHDILKSSCRSLDNLLDGGFLTKKLYELFGFEKVGKTTFLLQILCKTMTPIEQGGLDCPVVFIDSEDNFSSKKIRSFAPRFGIDPEYVLDNTARLTISNSDELVLGLEHLLIPTMEKTKARVILVDSIISKVRAEFVTKESLLKRQGILGRCAYALKKAINRFDAVAIIVNQVTGNLSKNNGIRNYDPCGGNILKHNVQIRIEIKFVEGNKDIREFFLDKCVDKQPVSCFLKLRDDGFHDTD